MGQAQGHQSLRAAGVDRQEGHQAASVCRTDLPEDEAESRGRRHPRAEPFSRGHGQCPHITVNRSASRTRSRRSCKASNTTPGPAMSQPSCQCWTTRPENSTVIPPCASCQATWTPRRLPSRNTSGRPPTSFMCIFLLKSPQPQRRPRTTSDVDNSLSAIGPTLGVHFLDAQRGDWIVNTSKGGAILICRIDVNVRYSKNWT